MSARRKRPAVCNIPPRPSCSLVGSWPEEQHWRRDLTDGGKNRSYKEWGTHSDGVMGAWRDPFLKVLKRLEEARNALTPWTPGSRHQAVAPPKCPLQSVVSLLLLGLALPYKTSALFSSLQNGSLCICLPALSAPSAGCGSGESGCAHARVYVRRVSTPTGSWTCRPVCVWEPGLGEHRTPGLLRGAPGDNELPPPAREDSKDQFFQPASNALRTQSRETPLPTTSARPAQHTEDLVLT